MFCRLLPRISLVLGVSLTFFGCQGTRPDHVGQNRGELAPCPDRPNCVSSLSTADEQRVEPFVWGGADSMQQIAAAIGELPRTRIIEQKPLYLYAEFESRLFGFVDDVEFMTNAEGQPIQVRSASRKGYSDMGANRERVEILRQLYKKKQNP